MREFRAGKLLQNRGKYMYVPYLLKMQIKEHTVLFFCVPKQLYTHREKKFVGPALTLTHDGMHSVKITQGENMKLPSEGYWPATLAPHITSV